MGNKMEEETDDRPVRDGSWGNWTEKQERNFVLAFLLGYIGFFLIFVSLVALFGK